MAEFTAYEFHTIKETRLFQQPRYKPKILSWYRDCNIELFRIELLHEVLDSPFCYEK
jgi:hypothetical protein